jgi:hypothetical protein
LIIDPPDGKVPELSQEANRRMAETRAAARGHAFDGPENRGLSERCLLWPTAGPPMMPSFYNNNYQIVQGPGYVTIVVEMIHDARIIPLDGPIDGRPHLPQDVRLWLGDPRGHWESNTLVVETTNFSEGFRGSNPDTYKMIERISRRDAKTLRREITFIDPKTWTRPWTVQIDMGRAPDDKHMIFDSSCHEGNYGLTSILVGARKDEQAAQKK